MDYNFELEEFSKDIIKVKVYNDDIKDKPIFNFLTILSPVVHTINPNKIFVAFKSKEQEYALYVNLNGSIVVRDMQNNTDIGCIEHENYCPYIPYEIYVPKAENLGKLNIEAKEIVGPNAHYAFVLYRAYGRAEKKISIFDLSMIHRGALLQEKYFDPIMIEISKHELDRMSLKDIISVKPFTQDDLKQKLQIFILVLLERKIK